MKLKSLFALCLLSALSPQHVIAQGAVPEVVTDMRFARGATMAFGRIKSATIASGNTITERGFCWSEQPTPTIDDSSTRITISHNGTIYWLRDLKPATKYYMRAYAKSNSGAVGYGDVIKFYTIPKGNITYSYNNGGDEAANKRINDAATRACEIFNDLTSITKHFSMGYSAGTPTADCNYKDEPWINMGPNASYQRTGTIMHEMQHGLGLVPYTTQWNKNILRERLDGEGRGSGHWLGDRVSAFLDFWDNTTGSRLDGDYQHMWPYGVNGAHEDDGTNALYFANAMLGQALGEDGLEHHSKSFADPCYVFPQEDTIKYYLKNESEERGLYTSYLVPTASGVLKWQALTAEEALANDNAAWYITFTPENQYYQLRNAATGQYLTYASTFKTTSVSSLTANQDFHLMKGRIDVGSGADAQRGYWIIHPTGNLSPTCIQANANGAIGSAKFNIDNSATAQRWLIMTAEELGAQQNAALNSLRQDISHYIDQIKQMAATPHVEEENGVDAALQTALSDIEQTAAASQSPAELDKMIQQAEDALYQFLCHATPTDRTRPFDLTYYIQNPGLDALDGWSGSPTLNYSCAEFYQSTFDFNQLLRHLPGGNYKVCVQGFQRPGSSADAYNDYAGGTNNVNAVLYGAAKTAPLAHIASEATTTSIGGKESTVGGNKYMPNDMNAASRYFAKGLYENEVISSVTKDDGNLRIGIKSTSMPSNYWVIFDNFRLYFYGNMSEADITQGIQAISNGEWKMENGECYDLQGRQVTHPTKGIYLVKGKKVVIR